MADSKVTVDAFEAALKSKLAIYGDNVREGINRLADKVTKEAVGTLKKTSPINPRSSRKHYRDQWKSTSQGVSRMYRLNTIHNKDYRLPHLLERPHKTRNGGRSRAQPHVEPVEQQAIKEMEQGIPEVVKNAGK